MRRCHRNASEAPGVPISRRDATNRLVKRADQLDAHLEDIELTIEDARSRAVPEAYWIAADYLRMTLIAERDWLRSTIDRLENKDLPWPRRTKS